MEALDGRSAEVAKYLPRNTNDVRIWRVFPIREKVQAVIQLQKLAATILRARGKLLFVYGGSRCSRLLCERRQERSAGALRYKLSSILPRTRVPMGGQIRPPRRKNCKQDLRWTMKLRTEPVPNNPVMELLNEDRQRELIAQPESGMGYQNIAIELRNGETRYGTAFNAEFLLYSGESPHLLEKISEPSDRLRMLEERQLGLGEEILSRVREVKPMFPPESAKAAHQHKARRGQVKHPWRNSRRGEIQAVLCLRERPSRDGERRPPPGHIRDNRTGRKAC